MTALIISSFEGFGISDNAQLAAILGLKQKGVALHVMLSPGSPYIETFNNAGVITHEIKIKKKIDRDAHQLIKKLIKTEQFDIIHAFNNNAANNAVIASFGIPVKIITYRGFTGHVHWLKPTSYLNHLNPKVKRVLCVSNAVRDQVRRQLLFNKKKAITIYKGHEIKWYHNIKPVKREQMGIPENAWIVGIVANVRPMKGIKYFINASHFLKDRKDIHFVMIGRGMDKPFVKKLLENSPLKDNFHILGFKKNVLNYVSAFDISVLSSIKGEGLSKTTIEAMSLKKPVIATNIGGNPEIVIHLKTGLLIPPKSSKSIATAILKLINDKGLRGQLSEQAYDYIKDHFTVEQTIEQTYRVYKELTN
jgi:glycosyltransferase involved in cell wall biosynthesis